MDKLTTPPTSPTENPLAQQLKDNDKDKDKEIMKVNITNISDLNNNDGESEKENKKSKNIFYYLFPSLKSLLHQLSPYFQWPSLPLWLISLLKPAEDYFEVIKAGSSLQTEIHGGIINFLSCFYTIPVISKIMSKSFYSESVTSSTSSLMMGVGCILMGSISNTPLIVTPLPALAIYLVTTQQETNLSINDNSIAVFYSGLILVLVGFFGPISRIITRLIPNNIQASVSIGIGLLVAFAGFADINLVIQGQYTLLSVGPITSEIIIAVSAVIIIALLLFYKSKYSSVLGLMWGSFIWWISQYCWPKVWVAAPAFFGVKITTVSNVMGGILIFELVILEIISLYGMLRALLELANLIEEDGPIVKGRYIMILIGLLNMMSGMLQGPPLMLALDAASGIKAGARTGLSSVVAGIIFLFSMFLNPLFAAIPTAGTAPVLIIVGMTLFKNVVRIDFVKSKYAVPGYVCMVLIPFTNSILYGVAVGYVVYVAIMIITGDVRNKIKEFVDQYFPLEDKHNKSTSFNNSTDQNGPNEIELASQLNNSSAITDIVVSDSFSRDDGEVVVTKEERERRSSSIIEQVNIDVEKGGDSYSENRSSSSNNNNNQLSVLDQIYQSPRSRPRRASLVFLEKLVNEVDSKNNISKQII